MVPILLLSASVMAEGLRRVPYAIGIAAIALAVSLTITQAPPEELGYMIKVVSVDYAIDVPLDQMRIAASEGLWGHGTGISTGAAGQMVEDRADYNGTSLWVIGAETYFAKALLELGLPGLCGVVLLLLAVLIEGSLALFRLRDRKLKAYGAALLSFLLIGILNEWKGAYLDLDPLNVYFWLFAGILFHLPSLEAETSRAAKRVLPAWRPKWRAGVIFPSPKEDMVR
jgi:uncharacterized membrane protein YhaH (DUF805 family)